MEEVKKAFKGMNPREKKLLVATIATVFIYLSYVLVFQSTFQKISNTTKTILTLSTELNSLKSIQKEVKALTAKAISLNEELTAKTAESKALAEGMQARGQIDNLLKTLESTAQGVQMRLHKMKVRTSVIRKSKTYKVENASGYTGGKDNSKSVKVTYIHNKIKLSSYSTYKQILLYIKEVSKLPYAISFERIEMKSQKSKSSAPPSKGGKDVSKKVPKRLNSPRIPKGFLETKIDMEIFFK